MTNNHDFPGLKERHIHIDVDGMKFDEETLFKLTAYT